MLPRKGVAISWSYYFQPGVVMMQPILLATWSTRCPAALKGNWSDKISNTRYWACLSRQSSPRSMTLIFPPRI
jgi:hypothetical protein